MAEAKPRRFAALRAFLAGTAADGEGGEGEQERQDGDGTGEGEGEGEGGDQGGDGGQDQGGDQGGQDDGAEHDQGADAAPDANHAQYRHGFDASMRRMAQVLTSEPAQTRLEAATGLLLERELSAERIIAMLPRLPQDSNAAALELLNKTPRRNLGAAPGQEGKDGSAGEASRKRAVERANQSRRPAKAGKSKGKGE